MIYIVLHKPYSIPKKDFYSSNRVRSGWISDGSLLTDKSGESIHSKNANYSELTAAYWIWKNKTDDIKGIIHYRRYFIKSRYLVKQLLPWMMLTEKDVHRILSYNDIIVPKAIPKKESLFVEYEKGHYINDLNQCKEVILELFPSYIDSFDYVINSHQKEFTFYYNMMIALKVFTIIIVSGCSLFCLKLKEELTLAIMMIIRKEFLPFYLKDSLMCGYIIIILDIKKSMLLI